MEFVTTRELRTESTKVWARLAADQDLVITRNGQPFALLVPTKPAEVERNLRALRAARLGVALKAMHRHAVETGLDKMTLEEINAEIALARKEMRERDGSGS